MALLKKVKIYSVARIYAVMSAFIGLILGLLNMALFLLSKNEGEALGITPLYGYGGLVLFPLVYGISGFVFGASSAYLYNLVSKYIGGIEFEIDKK
jgi:hypothetical protein